jgi:hypothetical protein
MLQLWRTLAYSVTSRSLPTFRRNIPPLSSGFKKKQSKQLVHARLTYSSTRNLETRCSETSVNVYQITRRVGHVIAEPYHAMKDVYENGRTAPPFLTSTLDGGEWSTSCPGHITSGERAPGTHGREWRLGGSRSRYGTLWRREKTLACARNRTPTPRPCSQSL